MLATAPNCCLTFSSCKNQAYPLKTSKLKKKKKKHLQANFINILLSKSRHIRWRGHGCLSLLILKPESLDCGLLSGVVLLEPTQIFATHPPPFPSVCSPALPPLLMLRQHKSSDLDKKIIQMKNNPAKESELFFSQSVSLSSSFAGCTKVLCQHKLRKTLLLDLNIYAGATAKNLVKVYPKGLH